MLISVAFKSKILRMAEGKKSFVLYCDFIEVFNELSDKDAGQLIKHIFDYVNDKNPVTKNPAVKISFIPIKNQLKRDLKEWEEKRTERSEAGKKGMASRWHNKPLQSITNDNSVIPVITNDNKPLQDITKITVNGTVTDTVNDNVTVIEREDHEKKFRIEDCLRISLNDSRWTKANNATETELMAFNGYLEKLGKYEYNPKDYKKYFATVKGKYPDLVKKKLTMEEFRLAAAEQDKLEQHDKHSI